MLPSAIDDVHTAQLEPLERAVDFTSDAEPKGGQPARAPRACILLVADPGDGERALRATLAKRGHALSLARSSKEGVQKLAREPGLRLVVVLLPLADTTSRGLVEKLRGVDTDIPLVVIGKDADVHGAGDAFELGAAEYLEEALADPPELLAAIGSIVGARRGDRHLRYLRSKAAPEAGWKSIIGESLTIQKVVGVLRQVTKRTQGGATPTIFLGGETGTGKGFIAQAVHFNGVRRNRPFVDVNCAALPSSLIEAELFGHERGTFTDAKTSRAGLFETADSGTLFLDEIGAVPLDLQAKLLTAIDEKKVRRIGARHSTTVDVQIIAATHESLSRKVEDGTFREDLFHRLNVVTVTIPPLRDRDRDVLLLARAFLATFCREYGMPVRRIDHGADAWMQEYAWPGNVRELKNQLERIVLLQNDDVVRAEHFKGSGAAPSNVRVSSSGGELSVALPPNGVPLVAVEKEIIRQALERCDGNVSRAARFLSISRQTLIYRIKKHDLEADAK